MKGRGLASRTLGNHFVDSVVSGKAANIDVFVAIYLGGWFLVTLAGHIASRWFGHTWSPPAHPLLGSALAGAVWPLLVIGLIEFSAIVVYANRGAKRDMGMAVLAECAHTGSRSTVSTIWEV